MSGTLKITLYALGFLAVILVLTQLGLGQMILAAKTNPSVDFVKLTKTHQHTGYLTVAVASIYIVTSLVAIARVPAKPKTP